MDNSLKKIVIMICSDFEWAYVMNHFKDQNLEMSPYGNWFIHNSTPVTTDHNVIWFKSGWGKIGSAGATQYVIDMFAPDLIINIGSCGGFKGYIKQNEVVLINETIVYDMVDLIGQSGKSIEFYKTAIDYTWLKDENILKLPKVVMVTEDQDLNPENLNMLHKTYGAVVGDWESGAIAWVAARNGTKLLILRGVSDLVGVDGNDAYGEDESAFLNGVNEVMQKMMDIVVNFISAI